MSDERPVISVPASGAPATIRALTKEDVTEARKKAADKKARFARVLERGFLADRLTVTDLPDDKHGQWVANNEVEIIRMQELGYTIDTEYAAKRSLHSDGTGRPIVGDVIFMTCSREDHEIVEDLRREQFVRMHGSPDEKRALQQREEAEFAASFDAETKHDIPVIQESDAKAARREELRAATSK